MRTTLPSRTSITVAPGMATWIPLTSPPRIVQRTTAQPGPAIGFWLLTSNAGVLLCQASTASAPRTPCVSSVS